MSSDIYTSLPSVEGTQEPSPLELGAAVSAARRAGWKQDEITLAGWIVHLSQQASTPSVVAQAPKNLQAADWTPTETLFAFMGWLTCRPQSITLGAAFEVPPAVDLISTFVERHRLPADCRDGWDAPLKEPHDVERTMRRGVLDRGRTVGDGAEESEGQGSVHAARRAPLVDLTADEALQVAQAPRCDCGAALTQCSDCAVADYQAAHTDCATCCPLSGAVAQAPATDLLDNLGLSIDMLDVDRLRKWADNIDTYGADLTQWSYPQFISEWLRNHADDVEAAVRDIGTLRASPAVAQAPKEEEAYNKPSPSYSDEYYLAMAALDQYPIIDRLPKSTSVIFRIHQLGHEIERLRAVAQAPATDLRAIIEDMRSNRARWAHSPGSLDVVYADKVDDWADELERALAVPSVPPQYDK